MDKLSLLEALRPTGWDLVKVIATAAIILLVTKVQLVSDRLSALLIALPLTSIAAMIWMYHQPSPRPTSEKLSGIATHAWFTFWYVLPTLPMFLVVPWLLGKGWGFYPTLGLSLLGTIIFFWVYAFILRNLGGPELIP